MDYDVNFQTHTILVIFVNLFETFVLKISIVEYNHKEHEVSTKFHKVFNKNWSYQ